MTIVNRDAGKGIAQQPQPGRRPPPPRIYYATASGGSTLDLGDGGGNPFASALIELAGKPDSKLRNWFARLRRLTRLKSRGHQRAESVGPQDPADWRFPLDPGSKAERREALVLVVSDYAKVNPAASLPGAAGDERRIASMLAQQGFSVTQGIGSGRQELARALRDFRRRAARADVALLYSTGHGVENRGEVFLLPGDYPVGRGFGLPQLKRHALAVAVMAEAATARHINLVFFAGCRTLVGDERSLPILAPRRLERTA